MKISSAIVLLSFFVSGASANERTFTASTPAATIIKLFLGIPLTDSIDFIRWKLTLGDKNYALACNFGLAKPNTDGFIDDGKKIELSGPMVNQEHFFQLKNGGKVLKLAEINADLFHILDADNGLLVGNGGWSYTLNNIRPSGAGEIYMNPSPAAFKDSMAFEGRSPCGVPGVIDPGTLCYKLKWYVVFYADNRRYKLVGTPYRKQGFVTGRWEVVKDKNGHIRYQLNNNDGKAFLYLLLIDEHILVFTDAQGNLLVGDKDFSYTLNAVL